MNRQQKKRVLNASYDLVISAEMKNMISCNNSFLILVQNICVYII